MKNFFFTIFLIAIFTGCRKDPGKIPYSNLTINNTGTIRDIWILNDSTFIICGGDNNNGFISRINSKGNILNQAPDVFDRNVTCLFFINDTIGFAGDDDIIIYKTIDGGLNWNVYYDTSWPLTVNRYLRSIWFTGNETGFICGGKNLGNGVLYATNNQGSNWYFSEYNHEYRGVCFADELNGVMAGHGSLLITNDGGSTFQMTDYNNYYFTGICLDKSKNYWLCDLNGNILYSSDKGNSWIKKHDGSNWSINNGQLNSVSVFDDNKIAAAGANGFLMWSSNSGNSWEQATSFGSNDILKAKWVSSNRIVAVGKKGGIYTVELQ